MRFTALLLVLLYLSPAEAGIFHRHRPTAAQQLNKQRKKTHSAYGSKSYRKAVKKSRKGKKAKLPALATRPKVTPY